MPAILSVRRLVPPTPPAFARPVGRGQARALRAPLASPTASVLDRVTYCCIGRKGREDSGMILTCPACNTRYLVPDSAVGANGRQVRCAQCRHSWFQEGPEVVA